MSKKQALSEQNRVGRNGVRSACSGTGRLLYPEEQNGQSDQDQAAGDQKGLAKAEVFRHEASESGPHDPADKPGAVVYPHRPSPAATRGKVRNQRRRRRAQSRPGDTFHGLDRKGELNVAHEGVSEENEKETQHRAHDHGLPPVTVGKAAKTRTGKSAGEGAGGVNQADLAGGGAEVGKVEGQDGVDHPRTDHDGKDGQAKGIKALIQRMLTPLRLFYHKKTTPDAKGHTAALSERLSGGVPAAGRERRSLRPRIVVDTNVVMGGLINPVKASGRLISLWLEGKIDVLISPALREEYLHIFNRMRFGPREAVDRRERAIQKLLSRENMTLVQPDFRLRVIKEDPSDNRLLECAVCGGAGYIVSQDRHLLQVGEYQGIKILTAHAFLSREFPEAKGKS